MKKVTPNSWAEVTAAQDAERAARDAERAARDAERAAKAKQEVRTNILRIAGSYTTAQGDQHDPAKVLAVAEPLLAWLDKAANNLDWAARYDALREVHHNWDGRHRNVSAEKLIEQASPYYRFIAV
jgi:uncharacterized membrane protein